MQSAPPVLPDAPPNGLTCGIDWARDDHAVCVVDATGRAVHRWIVEHTDAGLRGLLARLDRVGVAEVAIERPDGPVVDRLLGAGLTVVVISPKPAEEPPRPVRLGRQQGRPVRRVRAR